MNARGRELMGELQALRAERRREKRATVRRLARYRSEGRRVQAEATRILARLPVEPAQVVHARRAVLGGNVGWIRWLAELVLAGLPVDPDAAAHRAVLEAELDAAGRDVSLAETSHPRDDDSPEESQHASAVVTR